MAAKKKQVKKVAKKAAKKAPAKKTTKKTAVKKVAKKAAAKKTPKKAAKKAAKKAVKKSAKKAAKKVAKKAKKAAPKKKVVKKAAKKTVKKAAKKASPAKKAAKKAAKKVAKKAAKKAVSKTTNKAPQKAEKKPVAAKAKTTAAKAKKAPAKASVSKPAKLSSFVKKQRERLLELLDELLDTTHYMAQDTLKSGPEGSEANGSGMHQGDAGSDAYDRDLALNILSKEQDALYEVQDALRRIERGVYGICEISGKRIPNARLEAIPFCRLTVEYQEKWEAKHGKLRYRREDEPGYVGGL